MVVSKEFHYEKAIQYETRAHIDLGTKDTLPDAQVAATLAVMHAILATLAE